MPICKTQRRNRLLHFLALFAENESPARDRRGFADICESSHKLDSELMTGRILP